MQSGRQVDTSAHITGKLQQASCLDLSAYADASAYAWARLDVHFDVFGWTVQLIDIQSDVITLFESVGRTDIIDIPCFPLADAAASNLPFAVERTVENTQTAVLSMLGADLDQVASLTIPRDSDPSYSSNLPSEASFQTNTMTIRAEAQGKPTGLVVSTTVKLSPAGAPLRSGASLKFKVRLSAGAGGRRVLDGVDYCQQNLRVSTQADAGSSWTLLDTPALDCST